MTAEKDDARLVATMGRWGMRPVRCRACGARAWARRRDVAALGERATSYHRVVVHADTGRLELDGACIRPATPQDWDDYREGRI